MSGWRLTRAEKTLFFVCIVKKKSLHNIISASNDIKIYYCLWFISIGFFLVGIVIVGSVSWVRLSFFNFNKCLVFFLNQIIYHITILYHYHQYHFFIDMTLCFLSIILAKNRKSNPHPTTTRPSIARQASQAYCRVTPIF